MAAGAPGSEARPLINDNPELQSYYQSLESRIGYRLVLGGTRHFGYWYVFLLCFALLCFEHPHERAHDLDFVSWLVLLKRVRVAA